MSLRDYIRAVAKDVQAALQPKTGGQEQEGAGMEGNPAAAEKKKKGKKPMPEGSEEEQAQKRRRKERAQKSIHEERQEERVVTDEQPPPVREEERARQVGELPKTPSVESEGTMSAPVVEIADEGTGQAGTSAEPAMYQPQWPNIAEGTLLNNPILRAEWVARALPPAELSAYARAETFSVCDIANRAAILSTIAAYGMQRLLCAKDQQIEEISDRYAKAWAAYEKADRLVSEALRRERNLGTEVERLRAEAGEVPTLKTQLTEAQTTVAQLRAEVERLTTQGSDRDKEIENLRAAALKDAQELAAATGNLAAERQTRRYLMTSGIGEILSKVRMSDEYGKFVGGLVPKIQSWGKAELIKKMRHDYFPNIKPDEIPYFVPNAEQEAEEAFRKLRTEPFKCHILSQMAANPDMTEEEIRNLKNPELVLK